MSKKQVSSTIRPSTDTPKSLNTMMNHTELSFNGDGWSEDGVVGWFSAAVNGSVVFSSSDAVARQRTSLPVSRAVEKIEQMVSS